MHDEKIATLEARVRDLEAILNQNNHELLVSYRLTPAMSNLLGLLLAVPVVVPEMIQQRLEIATDSKVAIHRLRQHMKPHGINIESKRCLGYWLEPETKQRIRETITAQREVLEPPPAEAAA